MQAISSSQQSLMHRLLTQGNGNGSIPSSQNTGSRSAIEDIANRLHKQNGNGVSSYQEDGYTGAINEISVSNNTPSMNLTCDDCGIVKNSTEEMEIHIKTEHLNWLPFQCPICLQTRASDAQMREHLHSSHKKTMNKFIYVDDMASKRQLQVMMDRAIHSSITRKMARFPNSNPSITPDSGYLSINQDNDKVERVASADLTESPPAESSPGFTANVVKPKRSPKFELQSTGDTNTDALLASISRAANSDSNVEDSLASIFFNGYKMKMDTDEQEQDTENDDSMLENLVNPISVLDDVAALFANGTQDRADDQTTNTEKKSSTKIIGNQVSKKRVLGECSKCNKPVTAGARQMHMFFHLAKDHKTYRFRCLFEGCTVEHYRKDQMENHQSKIHGKIEPDMMEDRSLELFARCQELNHELFVANRSMITHHQAQDLSMELLGTKNGSTPGPTAAKAELAYQQQNAQKEKDKKLNALKEPVTRVVPDEEHPLECRLCHKTMQNRIRGFHILWHLAKDMGIMRYICKFCGFAHDRSQSVQTHGKKEHGADDVVLDKIKEYESEVNDMSEKCFGFQSSFSQDNKRRSKIPIIIPTSSQKTKRRRLENGEEEPECDSEEGKSREETPTEFEAGHELEEEDERWHTQPRCPQGSRESKPVRKRKTIRSARFGTRRPTSKSKRIEMLRLREISMLIGGAQYYKKKGTESCICEKCGKLTNSRLTEHAYTHIPENIFSCSICDYGHQTRDVVVKHMAERHGGDEKPTDNRLKFAKEIKESIRDCYPSIFVDAPVPTAADIEKLQSGTGVHIAGVDDQESDDHAEEEVAHTDEEDEKEGVLEVDEEEDIDETLE